jgi:hypothetical protein
VDFVHCPISSKVSLVLGLLACSRQNYSGIITHIMWVSLIGRAIIPSARPLPTQCNINTGDTPRDIHASGGIWTHDPSVWKCEDISMLRQHVNCNLQEQYVINNLFHIKAEVLWGGETCSSVCRHQCFARTCGSNSSVEIWSSSFLRDAGKYLSDSSASIPGNRNLDP